MTGSSSPGIRGQGENIFYFTPYDGKQYDPDPKPTTSYYPSIFGGHKAYRSRIKAGTKYDVRATYPSSNVLQTQQPAAQPLAAEPTLHDLFIKASIPEEDKVLSKLQEEERGIRTGAPVSEGCWLWRINTFSSDREYRWKVNNPTTKQKKLSSVVNKEENVETAHKGGYTETLERTEGRDKERKTCPYLYGGYGNKVRKGNRRAVKRRRSIGRVLEMLNRYSVLTTLYALLCIIPAVKATSSGAETALKFDGSSIFKFYTLLFSDSSSEPTKGSLTLTGYYSRSNLHMASNLLYLFFSPFPFLYSTILLPLFSLLYSSVFIFLPTHATLALFWPLMLIFSLILYLFPRLSTVFALQCLALITLGGGWGAVLAGTNSLVLLHSAIERNVVGDVSNEVAAIASGQVEEFLEWMNLDSMIEAAGTVSTTMVEFCIFMILPMANAIESCRFVFGIWAGMEGIWIMDRFHRALLRVSRTLACKWNWLLAVIAIVVADWVIARVLDWRWKGSIIETRRSSETVGHVSIF